jgi:hypothetical protein
MRRFGHSWPRVPETKVGRFGAGGQPLSSGPAHRYCGLSPDVWPKRTDCFWASNSSSVKALSRRNRDLGFLHTEEELTLFLEGEDPAHRRGGRAFVWHGRSGVRLRGAGPERVRAVGRVRLPDLRDDRPRPRARDGLLRPAGPDAEGSRRERHGAIVGAAPRRVRGELMEAEAPLPAQPGYSSFRQALGSSGWGFGVRSSRKLK